MVHSTNDGSVSSPLDLATALSASSPARPGDTIWLRDGAYVGNFVSDLVGSSSAPIIVRQYPGERAIIDANTSARTTSALTVRGSDTWLLGIRGDRLEPGAHGDRRLQPTSRHVGVGAWPTNEVHQHDGS